MSKNIRKIIYTTHALEGLHRQLRKVTKNRSVFPNDVSGRIKCRQAGAV